MKSAFQWTTGLLLIDLAVIGLRYLALSLADSAGVDIQPLMWPTVLIGGMLLLFAIILAATLICMLFGLLFHRWSAK